MADATATTTTQTSLERTFELVYGHVSSSRSSVSLRPIAKRVEFCMSLCLVALRIRTGYLSDSFVPEGGVESLQILLTSLRQISECFNDVYVLYDSDIIKYFFVNRALLFTRWQDGLRGTAYIQLGTDFTVIKAPISLVNTIRRICDFSPSATSEGETHLLPVAYPLPPELPLEALVPIAAILLDYPIAYVPEHSQEKAGLAHVRLDVYCVTLVNPNEATLLSERGNDTRSRKRFSTIPPPARHVVLQFSCPAELRGDQPSDDTEDIASGSGRYAPETIIRQLKHVFNARLIAADLSSAWMVDISHNVVERDGIAL